MRARCGGGDLRTGFGPGACMVKNDRPKRQNIQYRKGISNIERRLHDRVAFSPRSTPRRREPVCRRCTVPLSLLLRRLVPARWRMPVGVGMGKGSTGHGTCPFSVPAKARSGSGCGGAVSCSIPTRRWRWRNCGDMEEVVCEISKWEFVEGGSRRPSRASTPQAGDSGRAGWHLHDGRVERKCQEAEIVSQLSLEYPNVTGAIDDDLYGKIKSRTHLARAIRHGPSRGSERQSEAETLGRRLFARAEEGELGGFHGSAGRGHALGLGVEGPGASRPVCRPMPRDLSRQADQRRLLSARLHVVGRRADGDAQGPVGVRAQSLGRRARSRATRSSAASIIDLHPEQATWVRDFIRDH